MSGTLTYRVRIRDASTLANPDGTTDDLVITSVRGGTNPYLIEAPSGDGQEVDPVRGSTTSGTYQLLVADPILSGTDRLITPKLEDVNKRQQLISRRTYIEYAENGGAWTPLVAGYITALRLVNAITWQIDVGDTRRVERTKRLFVAQDDIAATPSALMTKRGCIMGGPIIGGWGPVSEMRGWVWKMTTVDLAGNFVGLRFIEGYQSPDFRRSTKLGDLYQRVNDAARPFATWKGIANPAGGPDQGVYGVFYDLRLRLTNITHAAGPYEYRPYTAGGDTLIVQNSTGAQMAFDTRGRPSPGSVNDFVLVHIYSAPATPQSPVYVTAHPADLIAQVYADAGITLDATSVATVTATLGANLRVSLRITEPQDFDTFTRDGLLGPFGMAVRVGVSGALELISTRIKTTSTPAQTITTNDLRDGDPPIFALEESTVVTLVTIDAQRLSKVDPSSINGGAGTGADASLDGVQSKPVNVQVASGDTTAFGDREIAYTIPGMVHDATSFDADLSGLCGAIAREMFDRYGRGAASSEVRLLRASGITAQPGDEIYVAPSHLPNHNKRYGDDPSVGARIMQVVKRTEHPEGPELRLVDSGTDAQPVVPAVTISIAASALFARTVAEYTITNAAAINATGVLQVAIEWATGAGAPAANGNSAARFDPGSVPTGATALPSVAPGSKVWVRARTEQAGRRPSAWTAWTSVTLTAATAPSALAASNIKQNAATLSWTNGSATDPVAVYVYEGGAPPADWSPYLVAMLPVGSTTVKIRNLNGPAVTHQIAVAHVYQDGSTSAKATASFATTAASDTAPRPAGLQVISTTTGDGSQRTGIALAVWASDPACDIEIERAPDVAGSPGAFVSRVIVPGSTKVWVDDLPADNTQRWYRIRHVLSGMTASGYTCSKAGTPAQLPENLVQPDPVIPVINETMNLTQGSVTGTMTVTITDPQCRVDFVEKRTKVDPGAWSGFSTVAGPSPYVATVNAPTGNAPGFGWIEMRVWGYDAQGNYGLLGDWTEMFDANTIPSIVMIEGSFKDDGSLVIRVNADDDTSSVYCTVSTSGYPSDGTLLATSAVNGRNVEFTFAGPYTIGTVVYVSAKAAAQTGGGGALSDTFQLRIVRGNDQSTKTIRLPASSVLSVFDSSTQTADISNGYYKTALLVGSFGFLPLPKGATLTAVRTRTYAFSRSITNDWAELRVFRVDDSGATTQLGSTAQSVTVNAWETIAVSSLSESTAGARSYLIEHIGVQGSGVGTNESRCAWIEYDITVPNFNVTT